MEIMIPWMAFFLNPVSLNSFSFPSRIKQDLMFELAYLAICLKSLPSLTEAQKSAIDFLSTNKSLSKR
ncbi:hypothetical protein CLW00_10679 [Mongoliibacter ruber]|uniref:Uncharacterized protein n=1 Tax=Mongoliibacter ruber TaxID=1750599 RepID=A0A2T0WL77_9BACT|nr:hypothetical protein CLW00_10679 [Mongoliibacter ruber]